MTFRPILTAAAALLTSLSHALAADPVVSNLSASQRPGTKLVDITYDLTADNQTVKVSLQISSDGGATYSVPVTAVSGAIGNDVTVSSGQTITWDAGVDWDGKYSPQTRFRVVADELIPIGFSLIPAGAFTMGDTLDGISGAPPVTVNVSAFHLGKYEITKAEWDEVRTWGLSNGYTDLAAGGGKASNHPVHSISWFDMVKWCNARSEKEDLTPVYTVSGAVMNTGTTTPVANWSANGYRLPTEAEWEKAARGGVGGKRFPWGTDTISHSQANYVARTNYAYDLSGAVNSYHPRYRTGSFPYTSPVGSFSANGYGLYDMAGNVREWCWDWHGSAYVSGTTDPRGAASGSYRLNRGGSWDLDAYFCRVGYRYSDSPTDTIYDIGFRVARSSSVTSGSGSAVSSNISFDTRNWTLSFNSPFNGSVSGAGSYLSATTATATATPSAGYLFDSWTGDASGSSNPLTLFMDVNKTVGASFVQDTRDPDSDGLSNYQEIIIHLTNPNVVDTDGDGYTDGYEVQFSTNPKLATSVPTFLLNLTNNGTATGGSFSKAGTLAHSTNATVTATPSAGYLFDSWTGDASGSSNPLTLFMDVNKTVGASFVQDTRDPDSDGLSNYQEIIIHLTNPNVADTDGDGLSDGWEIGVGRYTIVSGTFTWATARADARNRGGDLASFPTARQWSLALEGFGPNAFDPFTGLWLGASDGTTEGSWAWVSGAAFSFQAWATSRPSVTVDNTTDYLEVSGGGGADIGKWYDRSATTVRDGYLLEMGYTTSPTVADADLDGLNDGQEQAAKSHPMIADTDGDGLSDGEEVNRSGTDPLQSDTGNTGTPDPEKDPDGDGLSHLAEIRQFGTDPRQADSDGDGLRDDFELGFGRFAVVTEGLTWPQAKVAAIARGGHLATFTSTLEYQRMQAAIGLSALDALDGAWVGASDEVTDGSWQWISGEATGTFTIPWGANRPGTVAGNTLDYAEISGGEGAEPWKWYDRSPLTTRGAYIVEYGYPTNPLLADTDGDGILDGPETLAGLLPTVSDMDGDGWLDEAEAAFGGDPRSSGRVPMFRCELSPTSGGDSWTLRFPAATGALHRIQASTDLSSWQTLETDIPGSGRLITRTYPISGTQPTRFFRVLKD